jgi:excinuclease ABC subunit C
MDGIFGEDRFDSFGPDRFMPHSRAAVGKVEATDRETLRERVRQHAPRLPGVYGMIDAVGRLVYVGKSKLLRTRLLSYFLPTNEDEKPGRIADSAVAIVWESQPTDFAAMLREQWLIRHFLPRFNVIGIPNRQKSIYICVGRGPAELMYTANKFDENARHCQGPFFGAGRAGHAIAVLNRIFGLRDCSSKTPFVFADQLMLFDNETRPGCLRYEIGNCLGPCVEGCTRTDYQTKVEQAIEFLKSGSKGPLDELEATMLRASERLHFERAARLREDCKVVRWLSNRLADHAETRRNFTCIYPLCGTDGRDIWYLIRNGIVEHAVVAPKTQAQYVRARHEVERWFTQENFLGEFYARRNETIAIVNGWFRKYPQQRRVVWNPSELPERRIEFRDSTRNKPISQSA